MSAHPSLSQFATFAYPYESLRSVLPDGPSSLLGPADPGAALVWRLEGAQSFSDLEFARTRPPGMALIAILPPAQHLARGVGVLTIVDRCKPHSVLPFHPEPNPEDLARVLQRPPEALSVAVSDYLSWRGLRVDGDTRRMIRRTLDLSQELRTVSGLARALYMSRRALGRRFMNRALPPPSHWLQFGRVLRAVIRLQSSSDSLFAVAADLGYPDGFALSNQMKRMTGIRPTVARACLGWEWFVEAWMEQERQAGHFRMGSTAAGDSDPDVPASHDAPAAGAPTARLRRHSGTPAGRGAG